MPELEAKFEQRCIDLAQFCYPLTKGILPCYEHNKIKQKTNKIKQKYNTTQQTKTQPITYKK